MLLWHGLVCSAVITDKHAAARKKDVKNKWWYMMIHPTEAAGKVNHY